MNTNSWYSLARDSDERMRCLKSLNSPNWAVEVTVLHEPNDGASSMTEERESCYHTTLFRVQLINICWILKTGTLHVHSEES